MKQICFGPVSVSRILDGDHVIADRVIGGDGFYAYLGLRLCTPEVGLAAGIGADFDAFFGQWICNNQMIKDGLILRTDYCNYYQFSRDDWIEDPISSVYGELAGRFYYAEGVLFPQQFLSLMEDTEFAVFCERLDQVSIDELKAQQGRNGMKTGWIAPHRMIHYPQEDFTRIASQMDAYALSQEVGCAVFGVSDLNRLIAWLAALEKPFYLSTTEGAYVGRRGDVYFTHWQRDFCGAPLISRMGGRQSAAATAMFYLLQGADLKTAGLWATWSHACQSAQHGPCPDFNTATAAIRHVVQQETMPESTKKGEKYGQK